MKIHPDFICRFLTGTGVVAGIFLAGCASPGPQAMVEFQNVDINGQPAHLLLDTGGPTTALFSAGADRLGLKVTPPSANAQVRAAMNKGVALGSTEPAQVEVGGETFTAPLRVLDLPWYLSAPADADGMVGWTQIRDNILKFDGAQRTISALPNVPPEAVGWLKLKVRQNSHLLLEMPMADGTTALILVDTGNSLGLSLSPALWKAWRSEHPSAPSIHLGYYTPGLGIVSSELAWADEVKLGQLTLTDVAVMPADASVYDNVKGFAGTLGLYALTRLDLIVDGKNGYAYLRPKPAPGPYFPGFERPGVPNDSAKGTAEVANWKVADNVEYRPPPLLTDSTINSAHKKYLAKDYAGAIADLTNVIEQNPENTRAYADRANINLTLGDGQSALGDYNKVLELDPENFLAYRDRGVDRQVQGDLAGALEDFDQAAKLRPNGSTNPMPHLYRLLLQRRLGRQPEETAEDIASWKEGWPKTDGQYLTGSLSEEKYLAAAAQGDEATVRQQQGEAFCFIGMMRLINGDQAGARDYFQKCLAVGETGANEYLLARGELARLQ